MGFNVFKQLPTCCLVLDWVFEPSKIVIDVFRNIIAEIIKFEPRVVISDALDD